MKSPVNVAGVAVVLAELAAFAPEVKKDPAVNAMRAAAEAAGQMLATVSAWFAAWDSGDTTNLDEIAVADNKRMAPDQNVSSLDEMKGSIDRGTYRVSGLSPHR